MMRKGLVLIALVFPLSACSESEICIFGDQRTFLNEGISVEIYDYEVQNGIHLHLPDVVDRSEFRWATISFFDEDMKRIDLDLNANRVRSGLVAASFSTDRDFVRFSVFAHYGSSCSGTVIEQVWELAPNKGFNRTPESSGPAKPGELGAGAG